MFGKKTKTTTDAPNALVRQDSNVKTSSAQTETTNTTLWNATTFNTERNTVTMTTTRQTVTHQQNVRNTERITKIEPTFEEIQDLFRQMNINASDLSKRRSGNYSANFTNNSTGSGGAGISNNLSLSAKSTPKLKSTASSTKRLSGSYDSYGLHGVRGAYGAQNTRTNNTSSNSSATANRTLGYIQETNVTQKDGRKITATTETQAVKINRGTPIFNLSSPNSPLSSNYKPQATKTATTFATTTTTTKIPLSSTAPLSRTILRSDAQVITGPKSTTTATFANTSSAYTSPYSNRSISIAGPTISAPVTTTTTSLSNRSTSMYTLPPLNTVRTTNSSTFSPVSSINENSVTKKTKKLKAGDCFILNHEKFNSSEVSERVGSQVDIDLLKATLKPFKLNIEVIKNATLADIKKLSKIFKTKDYSRQSCLVVIIMTHGGRYDELLARDGTYTLDDDIIFPMLQNNTMMDKPKIFIVQACKGNMQVGTKKDKVHSDSHPLGGSPSEILKCFSTYEGFLSYRTEEGTIFIQTFCECLKKSGATRNIKDIMDDVIRLVKDRSGKTQIPTTSTTMTKPYVFGDYT